MARAPSGLSKDDTDKILEPGMQDLKGPFPHRLKMGAEAWLCGPPGLELTESRAAAPDATPN